ncbi:hypothetical protein Poly59_36670 [Rubripirellula reticaptiva]|uniref:Uncharacterized protein n=1 Tax=Rubripirellula reticaptiva TaxID=2528013 RepID=A0A5C6EKS7_9BACT|nr:hypothetical protein Poly59_36670 [Rubripirellula reticaptiva]
MGDQNSVLQKVCRLTVRQIHEKPGEVIGVVLKPLEKMADRILQPILEKKTLKFNGTLGSASGNLVGQLKTIIDQDLTRLNAIQITIPAKPRLTQRPRESNPHFHHDALSHAEPVTQPTAAKPSRPAMFLAFGA